jgi:hypothetical protein
MFRNIRWTAHLKWLVGIIVSVILTAIIAPSFSPIGNGIAHWIWSNHSPSASANSSDSSTPAPQGPIPQLKSLYGGTLQGYYTFNITLSVASQDQDGNITGQISGDISGNCKGTVANNGHIHLSCHDGCYSDGSYCSLDTYLGTVSPDGSTIQGMVDSQEGVAFQDGETYDWTLTDCNSNSPPTQCSM